jgi:tetratricopeptide (TPR) repeat protein
MKEHKRPMYGLPLDADVLKLVEAESERHPRWPDVQNRWGLVLLIRGRFTEAEQVFGRCLELNPHYAWAALNLAQCLALAGKTERAISVWKQAEDPDRGARDYVAIFLDLLASDPEAGLARLDAVPEDLRERHDFLRLRAALLRDIRPEEAVAVMERAARDPDAGGADSEAEEDETGDAWPFSLVTGLWQLWTEVSSLQARLGRTAEAEAYARRAFRHWSDRGTLLHQRGFVASLAGNDRAAVAFFEEAARVSPVAPRALISLAYHWSAMGELERAREALIEALRRAPRYADLHYQMGLLERARGSFEEALNEFRAALEINPRYTLARLDVAAALFDLGRWREARAVYRDVIAAGIRSSDIYLQVGEAEERIGNLEEAESAYREALRLNPGESVAHYHLGRLYRKRGDGARARLSWSKFLELTGDESRAAEVKALLQDTSF